MKKVLSSSNFLSGSLSTNTTSTTKTSPQVLPAAAAAAAPSSPSPSSKKSSSSQVVSSPSCSSSSSSSLLLHHHKSFKHPRTAELSSTAPHQQHQHRTGSITSPKVPRIRCSNVVSSAPSTPLGGASAAATNTGSGLVGAWTINMAMGLRDLGGQVCNIV